MTAGQIIQKLSYPDMYITSPNSYSSHVLQCTCHVRATVYMAWKGIACAQMKLNSG